MQETKKTHFILREANFKDKKDLLGLAQHFPLCSLPKGLVELKKKIQISQESFSQKRPIKKRNYLFVLEDKRNRKVIGSSQILPYFGESLCYHLKKNKKHLALGWIPKGCQQIGGLILDPKYRKSKHLLGLQIGAVRFLYMRSFPKKFSDTLEVSLTAPIQNERNFFWEETGLKTLKLSYPEAFKIFQENRFHFFSLFPKRLQFDLQNLSPKARKCLTKVHPQTEPVYKGLLKRGFQKTKYYHVLDGGVYLSAEWKKLPFLKTIKKTFIKKAKKISGSQFFLICQQTKKGFISCLISGKWEKGKLLTGNVIKGFSEEQPVLALDFPF